MMTLAAMIGIDLHLLDVGQQRDHVAGIVGGHRELDGRRVERLGGRRAEKVVDRRGDAGGGGEVGIAQRQLQLASGWLA